MRLLILSLLVFFTINVQAQSKFIYKEAFSNAVKGFQPALNQKIENGTLIINAGEEGDESLINLYLDPTKDYTISIDVKQISGLTENGFGLIWGSDDVLNNLFLINSNQGYAIFSGDPAHLKKWKRSDLIKPMGEFNQLKVEQKNGTIDFYINNQKIESSPGFKLYGNWLGILVIGQMQVAIDNVIVAQDQKISLPEKFEFFQHKENLGTGVNSADDELGPIISADGKTLYFARQNVKENIGGEYDDEDIWYSTFEGETWTNARNMGRSINTGLADNLVAVSADNNTMVFEQDNTLAVRHRTASGWSEFEKINLTFKNESDFFVASLSGDGKSIIFSAKLKSNVAYDAKRQEGDLYVCIKESNNKWSLPINLGRTINTSGDETSPFLSSDGRTLYFASDGRPGYGYQDIFFSRRKGEGWTEWTEPVNLGPTVNTPGFDAYYTVPAAGDYAYFVSYDKGFGKSDIFRIKLHEDVKPEPVLLVKGTVLNNNSKVGVGAIIHFEDLSTGKSIGEARSDPKTGKYQIVLPYGLHYGIRANTDGFYSVHENLELKTKSTYAEVNKDLIMIPIEIGETVKLNNVFFEPGLAVLMSSSYPELDRLTSILQENVNIHIQLEGHTDAKGDQETLLKLSQDRVDAVKAYLVGKGISEGRISGKGFGASKPVAPSDTEENSRLNRRVEFKITKK